MAWLITKDFIDFGEMNGERWSYKDLTDEQIEKICVHKFRLLDDDGEVYFEGLSSDSSSFAALDMFGSGYGCTDIQYYEDGRWRSL